MIQTINDAGVAPNHIIQVSGHKNVNSEHNYISLNEIQQRNISRKLSKLPQTTKYVEKWIHHQSSASVWHW